MATKHLKILLVKTTSLGDLIHCMPAVTDLQNQFPHAELHWLVEEGFADVPMWHPFVKQVHTCAIRRWRKALFSLNTISELKALKQRLQAEEFSLVIDAQGLVKSGFMARWNKVPRHGYDKSSIREKAATVFYNHKHTVSRELDAIERNRRLFAESLGYLFDNLPATPDFGLEVQAPGKLSVDISKNYAVFLHGTNWQSKILPVSYWVSLAKECQDKGMQVYLPWLDEAEKQRAESIAKQTSAIVLEKQGLNSMAYLLQQAKCVIGSDTGLSHIAAALDTKTVAIYGASNSLLTGLEGKNAVSIQSPKSCSPCMHRVCPLEYPEDEVPCYHEIPVSDVLHHVYEGAA